MIGSSQKVDSPTKNENHLQSAKFQSVYRPTVANAAAATVASAFPFPRLYRAHIGAAASSDPERTAFVEAASHGAAIRKIANAVAALELRLPESVQERIYNVLSATELIEEGGSADIEARLFEAGWSGTAPYFVDEPLFLGTPPGLIRKWASLSVVRT